MAEDKAKFILYCDQKHVFDMLSDEEAGTLIKHIFSYVNDENPISENRIINLSFEPIKRQLKRDLKKWIGVKDDKAKAGALGNLKRWNEDLYELVVSNKMSLEEAVKIAKDRSATNAIAKIAVNDTVNVTVTDTVNDTVKVKKPTKIKYSDFVSMKETEYNSLVEKYNKPFVKKCIDKLSLYKESSGKTYKSDAAAIRSWVVDEIKKTSNLNGTVYKTPRML
ncbi:MAG: hypothetical protein GY756_27075 [bacterium]|nr:hypothetical protein [bacterium]